MKVSFITTVFNEESTIELLLKSLFSQTKFPDEIIIVDGGSTDNTISEISNFKFPPLRQGFTGRAISNTKTRIKLIFKKGNRSVGRNEAIKASSNEIIVCSDAGCILDKNWINNIIKPFEDKKIDVVAGYYRGLAKTNFQKCLIPYALVMPDKVNAGNFLPASRSMAFKKSVWKKAGGFPEKFSNNEDYVFARKLRSINAKIVFEKTAISYWMPRDNIKDAFVMFYRFALGDAESQIYRPKVILIFLRYVLSLSLLFLYIILKSTLILNTFYLILIAYIVWSITKNYKYVRNIMALYYLPLIQFVSDFAVILGTTKGFLSFKNTHGK
jgi:glycosyltransferase involved in cell wall biosynthesis